MSEELIDLYRDASYWERFKIRVAYGSFILSSLFFLLLSPAIRAWDAVKTRAKTKLSDYLASSSYVNSYELPSRQEIGDAERLRGEEKPC